MAYSGAMEVRSLVEVFRGVAYNDDGMRPYDTSKVPFGWMNRTSGAYWSSDGDIGSINVDFEATFNAVTPEDYSTSTYGCLSVRGRALSGGSWSFGFMDSDLSMHWTPYYTNSSWETKVYYLPSGYSITSFYLRGTSFEADYIVLSSLSPLTITPINMTVIRNLTGELSEADLEMDYEKVKGLSFLGSHFKIWLSKDTTPVFHKVFTGIVNTVHKEIKGHDPRLIALEATDYGQYLQRRMVKRGVIYQGYLDEIIGEIVSDLVSSGEITTANIDSTNLHYSVTKKIQNDMSVYRLLQELAEEHDVDFYVDFGRDLHYFKRGTRESPLNIEATETTEFPYEEDITSVINHQEVIGADGKTIGSDSEWTESTVGWTSSGSLSVDYDVYDPEAGGAVSVKCTNPSGGKVWLARDVGTLDLSLGGVLCYSLQFKGLKEPTGGKAEKLKTRNYFIGPSGTFWVDIEASGAVESRRSLSRYDAEPAPEYHSNYIFYYYPFTKFEVPFNYKANYSLNYSKDSSLKWDEINTIKIEILSPEFTGTEEVWIDNMRIEQVHYSGTVEDAASIAKYGRRDGVPKGPDYSLDSDDKCRFMASIIVDIYKDPVRVISDVETIRNFTYEIGYEYTISVAEMSSIPVILRSIRHEVEGLDLHTYLSFSERWIPEPEKLFATLKNQLEAFAWNIEAWKRAKLPSAAIPSRSEQIEFWEAALEFPRYVLFDQRFVTAVAPDESQYEIIYSSGGYGSITFGPTFKLYTGEPNVADTECKIYPKSSDQIIKPDINSGLRARVIVNSGVINPDFGTAFRITLGSFSPSTGPNFYGFNLAPNGTIYFCWGNSSVNHDFADALGTYSIGDTIDLWAVYDAKGSVAWCYVNGIMKKKVTSVSFDDDMLGFYLEATASSLGATGMSVTVEGFNIAQGWKA